nr:MAG TPA: hypothetical protein [Caudoviricetes sp.]DAR88566.1 MAG TPA: hypothetical protein [Caudoviricetes sp.]
MDLIDALAYQEQISFVPVAAYNKISDYDIPVAGAI